MATDPSIKIRLAVDGFSDFKAKIDSAGASVASLGDKSQKSSESASSSWRAVGDDFTRLGASAGAAGVGLAALLGSAVAIGGALTRAQLEAQKLQASLQFSAGGVAPAAAELEYLRSTANKLGLDFTTAASAYAKFAASARDSGIASSTVKASFEGISKAASQLGLSSEETEGALLALSQMIGKGTVQAEELRGQLGERLPGAFQVAARAMGVSTAELDKMLKSGIAAQDFLPRFADELNKTYAAADNLSANLNRLSSAWDQFKQQLSQGGSGGITQSLTDGLNESTAAMRALGDEAGAVQRILVAIGGFGAGVFGAQAFDSEKVKANLMNQIAQYEDDLKRFKRDAGDFIDPREARDIEYVTGKIKELRSELDKLATQGGKINLPNLKDEVAQQQAARQRGLDAYLGDTKFASNAVKVAADLDAENKAFERAVRDFSKDSNEYAKALEAHRSRVAEIQKKGASAKSASTTDDATVLSDWSRRIALLDAEKSGTEKLSATEAAYVKVLDDVTSGRIKLTAAGKGELAVLASRAMALDQAVQAEREQAKYSEQWAAARDKAASDIERQITAQRDENAAIGLSAEASKELAAAKNDITAAAQDEYAAALRAASVYAGPYADAYQQAADDAEKYAAKLRELSTLQRNGAVKEAAVKAADDSARAWQRAGEQIEQALTDALMRGFENGKDFGDNFIDSLRNTIKTAALRLAVQVVVTGASNGLQSVLGAVSGQNGGTAGGLGQYGNALSTLSSLYGAGGSLSAFLGSSAGGTAGGFAAGWAGGAGSIGYGFSAAGNGYALSGSGQALGGISKVAWPLAVLYGMYMSGKAYDNGYRMDSSTYGGGAWGNAAKTITDTFTLEPLLQKIIGGRAAAILTGSSLAAQIVQKIRSKFGAGGEKIGGEAWSGGQAWDFYTPSNSDSAVGSSVSDIRQRINELASAFGGSASGIRFGLGFDADPRGKADSRVKAQLYDARGKMVYSALDVGAGRSQEELQAALGAQATRLMIAGLKASNIDDAIKAVFNKLDLNTLTDAQAQEALKAAAAVQQLGSSIGELWKSIGQNADSKIGSLTNRQALSDLFGGFDQLSQSVGAAYSALLTQEQQQAMAAQNLARHFGELNVAMPASSDALRTLIESQDLSTEAGRKMYAGLVALAPAFVQVQDAAKATAEAAANAKGAADAQAAADAFAKVQSAAEAFFRGVDRSANLKAYTSEGKSALDVVFGAVSDGALSAAQAAQEAAQTAVQAWNSATNGISSALQEIRTGSLAGLSPEERYKALRDQFNSTSRAAQGGNADAAQQLGSVAQQFLQASQDYFGSSAGYQSDRSAVDATLSKSLDYAKAQVSVQESIQAASAAALEELQRMNTSLTGFAGQALDLLRSGYAGGSRDAAAAAIGQLAQLQSNTDYLMASLSSGQSQRGAGYTLNKLDGGLASVAWDSGQIDYIRAGESVLEIAKRIPALREQWEKLYGIRLPAYATGTPFVQGDQLAQIHNGEIVIDAPSADVLRKYGISASVDSGLQREMLAALNSGNQLQSQGFSAMVGRLDKLDRRMQAVEDQARLTRAA